MMPDYDVESSCPACGAVHDGAASMTSIGRPEPGDLSICFDCGSLNVWEAKDEKLSQRLPTPDEALTFASDPEVRKIQATYWLYRSMNRKRWPAG